MSQSVNRLLRVELFINAAQPQFLEGLDVWLQLGLISEEQVKQLCQEYLTCAIAPSPITSSQPAPELVTTPVKSISTPSRDRSSRWVQPLQALMAELSVRWLLFLGIFMVVVSSGVLAASQWQRVLAVGQYGVLLGYTLMFWGVGFWASRQQHLQLTAQSLQIVTLLLLPVNFWAMDSVGLWQYPWGWLTMAIAACILTGSALLLLKNWLSSVSLPLRQVRGLPIWLMLGLSYLQWGWKLPGFPLIAVYVATVGTTLVTVYQNLYWQQSLPATAAIASRQRLALNLAAVVSVYALAVLLFRALFVVRVSLTPLGLAIGICGWLLAWLSLQREAIQPPESLVRETPLTPQPMLLRRTGTILLCCGWMVAVATEFPWQATAISGLGLWLFNQRLQQFWQRFDLAAIFGIGLQTIWLSWRLLPPSLQTWAIASVTQLTEAETFPWALLSLALFPYVVWMVGVTDWLYRRSKSDLARFGEQLALALGTVLTLISLVNPTLRSLNFLLSTVTLAIVTHRRSPTRASLVYLTHIMGLLTLGAAIARIWSHLSLTAWAGIWLVVMVAEWEFSLAGRRQEGQGNAINLWQQSAWQLGLGIAGLSYSLLLTNNPERQIWGLLWLVTPVALTGVASRTTALRQTTSSWLSVLALGMAQVLTLNLPGIRVLNLGVAAGLLFIHTNYLRSTTAAAIAIGFSLGSIGFLLWDGVLGLPRPLVSGWFLVVAIAILCLWLLRGWLQRKTYTLAAMYAPAADGWAIALCSLQLVFLTLHSLGVYWAVLTPKVTILLAIVLTGVGIAERSRQQPTNWAFYGLGWCLELLTAEALGWTSRSVVNLAAANVTLALATQLVGDWWRRRVGVIPGSWHILPLLYGMLAAILRWDTFTSWTGLSSLGIALVAIGIGRRQPEFKPLVYLGLLGVSFAAHELLWYQLLGVAWGDRLIAIAALNTSFLYAYRVLTPWLSNYLHPSVAELQVIAHMHWIWGSCLVITALTTPITSRLLVLGTGIFLSRYALFQGRHNSDRAWAESWVYLGLIEAAGIVVYLINTPPLSIWLEPLLPYGAVIVSVIAYFLYLLPWESWGWLSVPWQRAAIVLPLLAIAETRGMIYPVALLIAAGFYGAIAWLTRHIRFTYLSVVLVDWALWRWFAALQLIEPLWYITPIGVSLLYVAQFDPSWQRSPNRKLRHSLRLLAIGIICLVAFLWHQQTGIVPGLIGLGAIFAGLALRVRAYLYIGTATFLLTVCNQLVILLFRYPLLKWAIGLLVGVTLILIAAQFETRREQIGSLMRNWSHEWQDWE